MAAFRPTALLLAAWTAAGAGASAASAQCRLCDKPTTALSRTVDSEGLGLEIETSLSFDRLIPLGEGAGAAALRPDGSKVVEGGLSPVSQRAMVGTASVHGSPGRIVRISLPRRIDLYSPQGGRITVDDVLTDLPSLPRLDAAGNLTFRFGGRIRLTGDAEGDYRGDLPITAEYQ